MPESSIGYAPVRADVAMPGHVWVVAPCSELARVMVNECWESEEMAAPDSTKTYIIPVELEKEEDGRWSAWVKALPGCAAWGYTRDEALQALNEAAQAYIEVMVEKGQSIPEEIEAADSPVVAVSV